MFYKTLKEDIEAIRARDPAARSRLEVLLCYPGLHAVLFYRLGNALWRRGFHVLGRFVSHMGRWFTGIEIHPGARIGRRLFIDHGMGVVIGETTEIGDDVTLYQGCTLGGTSTQKGKRHPTLEDGVIVGSGAQVLGPITVGAGARVGANAVVLNDVPRGVTMVGIPARAVMRGTKKQDKEFAAYGVTTDHLPDPVARGFEMMRQHMTDLAQRVESLEEELRSREAAAAASSPKESGEQRVAASGGGSQ